MLVLAESMNCARQVCEDDRLPELHLAPAELAAAACRLGSSTADDHGDHLGVVQPEAGSTERVGEHAEDSPVLMDNIGLVGRGAGEERTVEDLRMGRSDVEQQRQQSRPGRKGAVQKTLKRKGRAGRQPTGPDRCVGAKLTSNRTGTLVLMVAADRSSRPTKCSKMASTTDGSSDVICGEMIAYQREVESLI